MNSDLSFWEQRYTAPAKATALNFVGWSWEDAIKEESTLGFVQPVDDPQDLYGPLQKLIARIALEYSHHLTSQDAKIVIVNAV
jgi:hypothetical protein